MVGLGGKFGWELRCVVGGLGHRFGWCMGGLGIVGGFFLMLVAAFGIGVWVGWGRVVGGW